MATVELQVLEDGQARRFCTVRSYAKSDFWCVTSEKKFYTEIELTYNVALVSGGRQSGSVIFLRTYPFLLDPFPYRSFQNIEKSSLCLTAGP